MTHLKTLVAPTLLLIMLSALFFSIAPVSGLTSSPTGSAPKEERKAASQETRGSFHPQFKGFPDAFIPKIGIQGSFQVSPTSVMLTTIPGSSPAPQTLNLSNTGQGSLNWSANSLPSWVSVNPTSGSLASGSSANLTLIFNTSSTTPQTYTANLTLTDPNASNSPYTVPITVVSANVSKTWYFAEGYTGPGFTEYLTIANPNSTSTVLTVQYLLQGSSPITKSYSIAANSRFTLNINTEIGPNQNVSMVVTGSQPIIAERPMYFNFTSGTWHISLPGGSDVLGATSLGTDFDFGYLDISTNHDTYLTILNQNNSDMDVAISYFTRIGSKMIRHTVPANSRGTVHVNDEGLPDYIGSILVHLSKPGLVERPMYLKDAVTGATGAADVIGVTQPLTDWYFAEGFVDPTFSEIYIFFNPSTTQAVDGTITLFRPDGTTTTGRIVLGPLQFSTIPASTFLSGNNSAYVHTDHPILAERFMSFKFSLTIQGATDVLGAATPSNLFYFAEGFTGPGFSEYLTIENPTATQTATVQVTFLPATGAAPIVQVYTIAPSSRFTLNTVQVINASFANQSFSMVVESNVPIVAERPMYFNFAPGMTGGSDVIGYQSDSPVPPFVPTTVYAGSADGSMYALNPTTGALAWSYQTPGSVDSTASFANGILYFGSSDGYFYAINASNGTLFWRFHVGAMSYPASAVVNGVVYLASTNGSAYALDATDGSSIWSAPLPGFFQPVMAAPLVANGVVFVMVDGRNLTALSAGNGSVLWSYQDGSINASTPAVDNNLVYFIDGVGVVQALQVDNGAVAWNSNALGGSSGNSDSLIAASGVVYAIDVLGYNLYAFNGTNGAVLWHTFAPAVGDTFSSPAPALANGILYTGDLDHNLYAYNASNGSLLWHYQTGNFVESTPTVANGNVYFGSNDGYIYALNASTGILVWRYQTGGPVVDTPTIAP